jgi:hypothetical protein
VRCWGACDDACLQDLNVANLWKVIDYEGMDRFRYRHAASAPAKAQALVQDMLLYLAVLDRCVRGLQGAGLSALKE